MGDPAEDLRATSDSIEHDAEKVAALERQKSALDPADPQVEVISKKVEKLVATMQDKAAAETALAKTIDEAS
jgi:hypothetical protein